MVERKLVVVKDACILPELGGIGGPILAPTRIPLDAILKMINNKRHVYECYPNDPRNEDLRVLLDQSNYKANNFENKGVTAPVPEAPVSEPETPVAEETAAPVVETPAEPAAEPVVEEAPVEEVPVEEAIAETEETTEAAPETPVAEETAAEPVVETAEETATTNNNQQQNYSKKNKKNK